MAAGQNGLCTKPLEMVTNLTTVGFPSSGYQFYRHSQEKTGADPALEAALYRSPNQMKWTGFTPQYGLDLLRFSFVSNSNNKTIAIYAIYVVIWR